MLERVTARVPVLAVGRRVYFAFLLVTGSSVPPMILGVRGIADERFYCCCADGMLLLACFYPCGDDCFIFIVCNTYKFTFYIYIHLTACSFK